MTTKPLAETATDWTIREINDSIDLLVKQAAEGQSVLDLGDDVTYDLVDLRARLAGIRSDLTTLLDELHTRAQREYPVNVTDRSTEDLSILVFGHWELTVKAAALDELHGRALVEYRAVALQAALRLVTAAEREDAGDTTLSAWDVAQTVREQISIEAEDWAAWVETEGVELAEAYQVVLRATDDELNAAVFV